MWPSWSGRCAPTPACDVRVRCFGAERAEAGTTGYPDPVELAGANAALRTMGVDLPMAQDCEGADVVHSHTWYANFGGHLASLLHGVPHVVTAHSLEPLRPWKSEQLGGGYALSSWVERTAYEAAAAVIAVSAGMRARRAAQLPGRRPRPGARGAQRDRHRRTGPGASARTPSARSGSTRTRRAWSSSAGSPGRRACPTSCAPRPSCRPTSSSCSAPVRRTPRRSWPRSRAWWTGCAAAAAAWSGSTACWTARTSSRCCPAARSSPARRCTSRWAS